MVKVRYGPLLGGVAGLAISGGLDVVGRLAFCAHAIVAVGAALGRTFKHASGMA